MLCDEGCDAYNVYDMIKMRVVDVFAEMSINFHFGEFFGTPRSKN